MCTGIIIAVLVKDLGKAIVPLDYVRSVRDNFTIPCCPWCLSKLLVTQLLNLDHSFLFKEITYFLNLNIFGLLLLKLYLIELLHLTSPAVLNRLCWHLSRASGTDSLEESFSFFGYV